MNWTALIDVDAAQKAGACREGLRWAREPRTCEELAKHRTDWLGWYASRMPDLPLADRIAMADRTEFPRYYYGMIAAHAPPGIAPRVRLRLIRSSDNPAFWIGYAASYVPGLSLRTRLAWAKRSASPWFWRENVMKKYGIIEHDSELRRLRA